MINATRITERKPKRTVGNTAGQLLREGARDKALEQFIPLFQKRGIDANVSYVKQALMKKFVTEANIHSLSLAGNYYLVGVARYYFNGDLTANKRLNALYPNVTDNFRTDVCERLDALINILRNAYIDSVGTQFEQPEDFGNLTIDKLLRKYNKKINKELGIDTDKGTEKTEEQTAPADHTAGKDYTYDIMYSYEDCKKYNKATTPGAWCITYGPQHYNNYIRKFNKYGGIHYVIFRRNGYENIPRKRGPGFTNAKPHDAYGNSLICVLQRNDCPEPTFITSRWNHGDRFEIEADYAYTKEEFLNVIGADETILQKTYDEWKKNIDRDKEREKEQRANIRTQDRQNKLTAARALKYMQMLINGGANPFTVKIPGIVFNAHPLGWDPREWCQKIGAEYVTVGNAPTKYPYFISVSNDDHTWTYRTVMDRKKILLDQAFSENIKLTAQTDKLFSLTDSNGYTYLYDRKRHQFISVDGTRKFKYIAPRELGPNAWSKPNGDEKYAVVAVSGHQAALINLNTLKPVATRNGAVWFESITAAGRYDTMTGYHGEITLPQYLDLQGTVLKMIYDSASGEKYYYNTKTDAFVNPTEGLPGEWNNIIGFEKSIGPRYITISKSNDRNPNRNWPSANAEKLFRNMDDGSIYTVNGVSTFTDFMKAGNVVAYMTEGSDTVNYFDTRLGQTITFNGKPLTTWHGADTIEYEPEFGYVRISLSRYVEEKGTWTYGNSYRRCLLYNNETGEFYHDDISGYIFNLYGYGHGLQAIIAYIPTGKEDEVPDRMKPRYGEGDNYFKYLIQPANNTNESTNNKIGRILREAIKTQLGIQI